MAKLAVVAPNHLLSAISASLDRIPETRTARAAGALILSSGADRERADAHIVIAPEFEHVADWAFRRDRFELRPLEAASRVLARLSDVASTAGAVVIKERDLKALPGLALEAIGAHHTKAELIEKEAARLVEATQRTEASLQIDVEPLKIYSAFPITPGAAAWWPRRLFNAVSGQAEGPVDIMGRPRVLYYGPYLVLTHGPWRADLEFDLSEDAARYDYRMEFGTISNFSEVVYHPSGGGRQKVSIQYDVRDYFSTELRIGLVKPAFHGEVDLIGAKLTKLGAVSVREFEVQDTERAS